MNAKPPMPTVVIADDHALMCDALKEVTCPEAGLAVVACVHTSQDALQACRQLKPAMLLIDIEMPGRDVFSVIDEAKMAVPELRVVLFSAFCRDAFITLALRAGVLGYLLKSDQPGQIIAGLRQVIGGGRAFSAAVASRIEKLDATARSGAPRAIGFERLSRRELEILRYIGRGMNNAAIAQTTHLSQRTVEHHVARLMQTVDIHSRSALTKYAFDEGLV